MKPKLTFLLLLFSFVVTAQTYKESIAEHRKKLREDMLADKRQPVAPADIDKLTYFEADEKYKVTADFVKKENAQPFDMATLDGKTKIFIEYGTLTFTLDGKKNTLKIYQNEALLSNPEKMYYLFLPFTDATSGKQSYVSGRYMDFNINDIQKNKLVIDFNKAYNPLCAYSDRFSCPKPPEENALKIPILAGEKAFTKGR